MRSQFTPFGASILGGTRFPLQSMWDLTIHPLRDQHPRWHSFPPSINVGSHNPPPSGPASSVALVSLFNQCRMSQFTPFKASVLGGTRFPLQSMWDLTIGASILGGTRFPLQSIWDLTIHPLRGQRPRWHSFPSSINVGSHNRPPSRPASSVALVSLFNQCGISQSTPFGARILGGTRFPFQSIWDLTIHSLRSQRPR